VHRHAAIEDEVLSGNKVVVNQELDQLRNLLRPVLPILCDAVR
jgi:hypothetical protein